MKLRIYCLLSKESKLTPISGDRINEMNLIRALMRSFDVYYNGQLCHENDSTFGRSDGQITVPKEGEYDLVYVRNNKDVFMAAPSPKIWFASPYDKECFDAADGIACMTKPWRDRLATYTSDDYDYFVGTYPVDMPTPQHCLLFPQTIEMPSDAISVVEKNSKKSLIQSFKGLFIKSQDNRLSIKHFGPIRPSNFPHQMIELLERRPDLLSKVDPVAVGPGKKMKLPKTIRSMGRVDAHLVPSLLQSSDAIWYNQDFSGNIAGSLKVLEAMSYGVPVLSPKWDARVDEMGEDYPWFWEPTNNLSFSDQGHVDFEEKFHQLINSDAQYRKEIGQKLKYRAEKFSIDNVADILSREISDFLDNR